MSVLSSAYRRLSQEHKTPKENGTPKENDSASSPEATRLGIANVANIFVRMKRVRAKAAITSGTSTPCGTLCKSGEQPLSHPGLVEAMVTPRREPLDTRQTYVCSGGVNTPVLLRAARCKLLDDVRELGANALVDEKWSVDVHEPKTKSHGTYKVHVTYHADAVRSNASDPGKPVALEKAKSIPGLMTIVRRESALPY
ncbi:hypothetical protein GGG16DRAFT_44942 [Schizophyllum commune]